MEKAQLLTRSQRKALKFKPSNRNKKVNRGDLIFYILMLAYPVIQFCIFYIGVNSNSFLLGFQDITYDVGTGITTTTWSTKYIEMTLNEFLGSNLIRTGIANGVKMYFITFAINTPLSLLFSYFVYKRCFGYNFFRVILFLPAIIPGMALVLIYHEIANDAFITFMEQFYHLDVAKGLVDNPNTRFWTLMFFCLWTGFGGGVLLYSDSMGAISPEVVESAYLDGATGIREFLHITFPLIFGTWSTFLICGVAGVFTGGYNIFSFYSTGALDFSDIQTFGYYLYIKTLGASNTDYPKLAAYGFWTTLVCIPLTFLVRWACHKFGPSTD